MKRFALAVLAVTFLASACAEDKPAKPRVVASFLPIYCFTVGVAGDLATVDTLIPGGVSAHEYQFTPQDVRKLQGASVVFINGLGVEPWKGRLARNAAPGSLVEVTAGLEPQLIRGSEEHHDHSSRAPDQDVTSANPHIWLDVQLAIHCVSNIINALSATDAANASRYRANGAAYIERLRALDSEIAAAFQPFAGKAIMTYHDALPYFARRYGIKIAAVVQPVPEVNPSPRRLSELRQIVREQDVKALLLEPGSRNSLAERIAKEFSIQLVRFDVLETGPLVPSAYEDGMRRNVNVLVRALQ